MGYVYFLGDDEGGPVKVGYAKYDVNKRLTVLQTGYPRRLSVLAVIKDVPIETETAVHRFLSEHRMHGEWFARTPCVHDLIDAVNRGEIASIEQIKGAVYVPDDFDAVAAIIEMRKLEKRISILENQVALLRGEGLSIPPANALGPEKPSRAEYMREYRKRKSQVK